MFLMSVYKHNNMKVKYYVYLQFIAQTILMVTAYYRYQYLDKSQLQQTLA